FGRTLPELVGGRGRFCRSAEWLEMVSADFFLAIDRGVLRAVEMIALAAVTLCLCRYAMIKCRNYIYYD
ncbi:MAG: hypothetical protein P8X63_07335, partial [Desulfuromonadaceae bacterium]